MFLTLFLPVAALVLVIGFSFIELRTESRIEELLDHDSSRLHRTSGFIGAEISVSLNHLRALAVEPVTRQALDPASPQAKKMLEQSFLTLALRNPHYQQIRWLDENGMEKARITRDQDKAYIVALQDLQDKSKRYYFKAANTLLPGELYVSRIDLNVEHGQIEMPPRPMLRIATPVEDSTHTRRGILIINISMNYLFDVIRNARQSGVEADYLLLNQEGFLVNSQLENASASDAADKSMQFSLSHPKIWQQVSTRNSGSLQTSEGLWTWKTLSSANSFSKLTSVFPQRLASFDKLVSNDFSLTLVAHRPLSVLLELRREIRILVSLGIVLILAIYGLSLFFYLNGHVRAQRAELNAAYAMARAANMARMKELEERFQRLVAASSIGQLVVNEEGQIELSNPAAEQMLGYNSSELNGMLVDKLLPDRLQDKHVQLRKQYMRAPQARKMGESRELQAVKKQGTSFPVEVGLNPYTDQGRKLILVSIIDLSDRVRVDQVDDQSLQS
jgi:PAS domain S-box-containing protein